MGLYGGVRPLFDRCEVSVNEIRSCYDVEDVCTDR